MKAKVNVRCAICGEIRAVESAHIMPQVQGGKEMMSLCPNHHKAYDAGLLNAEEINRLPLRAKNYYMEKYGKSILTSTELGIIESTLDAAGFSGEYRQGYHDAMRDVLLAFKSKEFVYMTEETMKSAMLSWFGDSNTLTLHRPLPVVRAVEL